MKQSRWKIIMAIIVLVGGMMMLYRYQQHQEELRRNREYEISLVNALKNSYEGIEEIEITEPDFTEMIGSWSCDVAIRFSDKQSIKYRIGHALEDSQNYNGSVQGDGNEEINEQWKILNSHKGKTTSLVVVIYSDKEKGEQ